MGFERRELRHIHKEVVGTMPQYRTIPVSYTHLDVYKRQMLSQAAAPGIY